ncbi:MAG: UDP-N-acetylmuramoyl-tripeptide--D-alanyl-D-alanine ligase [Solirubrobacteraceae bacterium]
MNGWDHQEIASAAGAELVSGGEPRARPRRAVIDSRDAGPGDLFVGLPGARADGGAFAQDALDAGAWGVLVAPQHAGASGAGATLVTRDPLAALQRLARAWRRALGARVVAITGSTGKTSTKDILAAVLAASLRTVATEGNLNTEIGVPLAILRAPQGTQALVLELAMRGAGQITELAEICEPDVGVIVNIGPAHLELLGSLEAIAAAKAELLAALPPGAAAVIPAAEPLLEPHLRGDLELIRFGDGGDVFARGEVSGGLELSVCGSRSVCEPGFRAPHQVLNLLAAAGAAAALGAPVPARLEVAFSGLRGELLELPGRLVVIDDCYNANPMSMQAALLELARSAEGRRVAVLGEMLELGPEEQRFHRELGELAREQGVQQLIAVGSRARATAAAFGPGGHHVADASSAAELLAGLVRDGDTVLVKGSRGVGLEVVAPALAAARGN